MEKVRINVREFLKLSDGFSGLHYLLSEMRLFAVWGFEVSLGLAKGVRCCRFGKVTPQLLRLVFEQRLCLDFAVSND